MTSDREFQQHMTERVTKRVTRIAMKILMFAIFAVIAIFVFSEIVLHLWNWLMPSLFHLSAISSFWQALGLMILCWILFGGLRGAGRGFRGHGRRRMRERWEQMTPEERDKFREWIQTQCGPASANATPQA